MANALTQTFRNVGRLSHIVNVFARYGFRTELQNSELGRFLKQTDSKSQSTVEELTNLNPQKIKQQRAKRFRQALEDLGPTFVKLGQLLATREDLLPKHYLFELKKLQDDAKPLEVEIVKEVIESQLNCSLSSIIQSFEDAPLGAASIGQVHKAVLLSGEHVVFKIQRPGIVPIVQTDLSLLLSLANILEAAIAELRNMRISTLIEELNRSLNLELDYTREAGNTERAASHFKDSKTIYIPKVYRKFCTKKVLCLEAIEGQKLSARQSDSNNSELVKKGVSAFFDMTFKFGTFHADLHAGNFLLLPDSRLAILDFGLTARLSRENRLTLSFLFLALVSEDIETFARLFVDFTEPKENGNTEFLLRDLRTILESALCCAPGEIQLGKLLMQTARSCARNGFPVARDLVLFFRALIALESFGRSLDPNFDAIKEAHQYSKSMALDNIIKQVFSEQEKLLWLRDAQSIIRDLPLGLKAFMQQLRKGIFHLQVTSPELKFLAKEIDRASNRMSLALLLGSIVLGSSLLTFNKRGPVYDSLSAMGIVGFGIATLLGIWLIVSIIKSGGYK